MTTLTYQERQEAYRAKMIAKQTTLYKGWEIIKRRTVITTVNAGLQVMEYIIKNGDHKEYTFTLQGSKELIDRYEQPEIETA